MAKKAIKPGHNLFRKEQELQKTRSTKPIQQIFLLQAGTGPAEAITTPNPR